MSIAIKGLGSLLEQRISRFLESLRPQFDWTGYQLRVALLYKKRLQEKQGDAPSGNWSPSMLEIRISIEPVAAATSRGAGIAAPSFRPIPIRGEPLTETVLRVRR
jgi:hypothetical protein